MSKILSFLAGTLTRLGLGADGPEKDCLYFRCPSCGQKLRYLAHKAGRSGPCPRCLRLCTTPATPPAAVSLGQGPNTIRVGRKAEPFANSSGRRSA